MEILGGNYKSKIYPNLVSSRLGFQVFYFVNILIDEFPIFAIIIFSNVEK